MTRMERVADGAPLRVPLLAQSITVLDVLF